MGIVGFDVLPNFPAVLVVPLAEVASAVSSVVFCTTELMLYLLATCLAHTV